MAAGWLKQWEWLVAPVCEALLIGVVGAVAWGTGSPMLFASLGPTAYELVETPGRPSARAYNVLVGHGCGIGSGLLALLLLGQWKAAAAPGGGLTGIRVLVAAAASLLTVFFTLLVRAGQPAAVASSLVVALGAEGGSKAHLQQAACMAAGIVLLRVVAEPLRRWRLTRAPREQGA